VSSSSHSSTRRDLEQAVETPRTFNSLVLELNFLKSDQLDEVTRASSEQQVPIVQMAQNLGLLNATQLAIIETLLHPDDAVPGYQVTGLLGRGGMGVVYRARQKSLNRIVALKTVSVADLGDATSLQRFEQEAVTLGRLTHPHIVAAYDFGKHRGRLFFAMELVLGEDCERFVRRNGPLEPMLAFGIIRQAAAGLAHAAASGIVHRDIKPANLLLLPPPLGFPLPKGIPLVKIADFGLAHLTAEGDIESRTRLTMNNAAIGSPYYMAPEQLDGIDVDQRADIYALGISAWHLLAGHPPLVGKPLSQLMAAKLAGEIPSIHTVRDDISESIAELIAAMIRRSATERIHDYDDLLRRIDELDLKQQSLSLTVDVEQPRENIHGIDTVQLPRKDTDSLQKDVVFDKAPPASPKSRWSRRRIWLVVAGIVATIALTAIGLQSYRALNDPGRRMLVPSHDSAVFLFDGESIPTLKQMEGEWSTGLNDEGSPVLIGEDGGASLQLPSSIASRSSTSPLEYYRLEFGMWLHKAKAVELHFDIPADNFKGARSVLRMTAEGTQLGHRKSDRTPFQARRAIQDYRREPDEMHSIVLERQPRGWWLFVDGQFAGAVRARSAKPAQEFRLAVEKGPAWISDIAVERLAKP